MQLHSHLQSIKKYCAKYINMNKDWNVKNALFIWMKKIMPNVLSVNLVYSEEIWKNGVCNFSCII